MGTPMSSPAGRQQPQQPAAAQAAGVIPQVSGLAVDMTVNPDPLDTLCNAVFDAAAQQSFHVTDSTIIKQSEANLSAPEIEALAAKVSQASRVVAAGILETGGKETTVADLVRSLAAANPGTPDFSSVLRRRASALAFVFASLNGFNDLLERMQAQGKLVAGTRVMRGRDWSWQDQDGGEGRAGTILALQEWQREPNSAAKVKWDAGGTNVYRCGFQGLYDIQPLAVDRPMAQGWSGYVDLWLRRGNTLPGSIRKEDMLDLLPSSWEDPTVVMKSLSGLPRVLQALTTEPADRAATFAELVGYFQRFFLAAVAGVLLRFGDRESKAAASAEMALALYCTELFKQCIETLGRITAAGSTDPASSAVRVEAELEASPLRTLLPFCLTSCLLFVDRLKFSIFMCRIIPRLLAQLDAVCECLPAIADAESQLEQLGNIKSSIDVNELLTGIVSSWVHQALKGAAYLGGQVAATCIAGAPETATEEAVGPWLKSCVFVGGVEDRVAAHLVDTTSLQFSHSNADFEFSALVDQWLQVCVTCDAAAVSGPTTVQLLTTSPSVDGVVDAPTFLQLVLSDSPYSPGPSEPTASNAAEPVPAGTTLAKWLSGSSSAKLGKASKFKEYELAFLAALVHHSGTAQEAFSAVNALAVGATPTPPSAELLQVWDKVKALRFYLDQLKAAEAAGQLGVDAVSDASKSAPTPTPTPDASLAAGGQTPASPASPRLLTARVDGSSEAKEGVPEDAVDVPTTFQAATRQVILRCRLLCACASAADPSVTSPSGNAASLELVSDSQLKSKWADLVAPPALPPLLSRWRSTGMETDLPILPPPKLERLETSTERVSGIDAILAACFLYAAHGLGAQPETLLEVARARGVRAAQRVLGLQAMLALLKASNLSSVQRDVLIWLRSAFRGAVQWAAQSNSRAASTALPDPSKLRHHYWKGLEGVFASAKDRVQGAFIDLYVHLASVLADACRSGRTGLAYMALWSWGLDFEAQDHELILRLGLLPALHGMFSLGNRLSAVKAGDAAGAASETKVDAPVAVAVGWRAWPLTYVQSALHVGTLSKRELVLHMKAAPTLSVSVPSDWRYAHILQSATPVVTAQCSVPYLLEAYASFCGLLSQAEPSTPAQYAASIIQDAYSLKSADNGTELVVATDSALIQASHSEAHQRCMRKASWALFRTLVVAALGCRRGVKRTTTLAGIEIPADVPVGSATYMRISHVQAVRMVSNLGRKGPSASSYSTNLRSIGMDVISSEAQHVLRGLGEARGTGPTSARDCVRAEHAGFSLLCFLSSIRDVSLARGLFTSPSLFPHLLALVDVSSPRMMRVLLMLLRSILSSIRPSVLVGMMSVGATRNAEVATSFVISMLDRIGNATIVDDSVRRWQQFTDGPSSFAHPIGFGAAHVAVAAASECVALLRTLLHSDEWCGLMQSIIEDSIVEGAAVVSAGSLSQAHRGTVARCAAALNVIGGAIECLRVGVSVRSTTGAAGVVISSGSADGTVQVVYDPSLPAVAIPVVQLQPTDETPVQPSKCPFSDRLLAAMKTLISLNVDVPTPVEEAPAGAEVATGSASDTAAASGGGGGERVALTTLWLAQLYSRSVRALTHLLSVPAWMTAVVESSAILTALLTASLRPVPLQSFVSLRYLLDRSVLLQERLLEWSLGVQLGGSRATAAAAAAAPSVEDQRRQEAAAGLSSMGFPVAWCVAGLKKFGDDPSRTLDWLLSGEAEAFVNGGGLESAKAEESSRQKLGREIGPIVGLPPTLCALVLQVYNDDQNAAMNWLLERGSIYVSSLASEEGDTFSLAATAVGNSDDDAGASLNDLDLGSAEPLIVDATSGSSGAATAGPPPLERALSGSGSGSGSSSGGAAGDSKEGFEWGSGQSFMGLFGNKPGQGVEDGRGPAPYRLQAARDVAGTLDAGTLVLVLQAGDGGDLWRIDGQLAVGFVVDERASTTAEMMKLRSLNEETGALDMMSCGLKLFRISHLYGVPVTAGDRSAVVELAAAAEVAVALHAARAAVVTALANWPSASPWTSPLIGVAKLVALLKLVAASEFEFAQAVASNAQLAFDCGGLMPKLRKCFTRWLLAEASESTSQLSTSDAAISRILVEQVASNMMSATSPSFSDVREMCESLHPHHPRSNYVDSVTIPNARAVWVAFDPRSELGGDAELVFFSDATARDIVLRMRGRGFRPFVVHSDTVHFAFRARCNEDSTGWGYRMYVSPMQGLRWLQEMQVCKDPSLEWACYILEFLLNDAQALVAKGVLHSAKMFNAMVHYLRARGTPFKHRVIALLTQLLKSPQLFNPADPPELSMLSSMENALTDYCDRELSTQGSGAVMPARLLQFVELLCSARTASRVIGLRGAPLRSPNVATRELAAAAGISPPPVVHNPGPENVASAPVMAILVDVMDLTECLYRGARVADEMICRVLRVCKTPITAENMIETIKLMQGWTRAADAQLVQWATSLTMQRESDSKSDSQAPRAGSPQDLQPSTLELRTEEENISFPLIAGFSKAAIQRRFALLQLYNARVTRVMPLLDVMNSRGSWSLGYKLRALSSCVFLDIKTQLLQAALDQTWSNSDGSGISLTLDNQLHRSSVERAERDPAAKNPAVSKCMFVQVCQALSSRPTHLLRSRLNDRGSLFRVQYSGEDGADWGGLYRDCLSRMIDDLFSSYLDLTIIAPNFANAAVSHGEVFIPNPIHTTPQAISMFEFVGKLIGISLRTKNFLPFEFAPVVWKMLVGETMTEADLSSIDTAVVVKLTSIRKCHEPESGGVANNAMFEDLMTSTFGAPLMWTVETADGRVVELIAGGAEKRVTFETRLEYVEAAFAYRCNELVPAVQAMARGLYALVPQRALSLLTWRELELSVCGDPVIDIAMLKRHTTYHGWDESHSTCQQFWRVMGTLSQEDRSQFIRFAWGRSRLPKESSWTAPFKLTKKNGGDELLPLSHTCFFQIELPCYSSEEVMRRRILAAIYFGTGEFIMV